MKRLIILFALLLPSIVHAQTVQDGFVRPPDVPAYVEQFNGYAAGVVENTVGDGSTARGGTPPVLAIQPADIPSVATGWITVGTGDFTPITNVNIEEVKFRTVADQSHCNFDDPVRNWGAPGTAHLHCYAGNKHVTAYSTYASLRTRANAASAASKVASTTPGGPYFANAYWWPAIIKPNAFGDGKNYALKASDVIIYYVRNPANGALADMRLPRGLRFIYGTNMDDPDDTVLKAQIAAANAQTGTAGRYTYNDFYLNGFLGWKCLSADKNTDIPPTVTGPATEGTHHKGFTTASGADPWGGNCNAGKWLVAALDGVNCYDGKNLWSPGGYKHVRRAITDTVSTLASEGCPKNWFQIPGVAITFYFKHQGFADYSTWYLSSDAQATAKRQLITPAAPAVLPGASFHTDWMNGWDDTTLMKWTNFCHDNDSTGGMNLCSSSTISATEFLTGGPGGNAPDGSRTPQVVSTDAYSTVLRSDMTQVPASLTGPRVTQVN